MRLDALRALASSESGAEVTCSGGSMEPTLHDGARVRVRAVARLRAGDVVLLASADGSGTILHRVVALLPGTPWFLHCGDAGRRGGAGIARRDRVIGRADLARRRAPGSSYLAVARALVGTAGRELRVRLRTRL